MDITRFGVGNKSSAEPPIATQAGMASTYDYNSPIPMDNIQNERFDGFVRPVGGVVGDGPFTFEIPALSDAYLLLNKIGLYVRARIVKADGEDSKCDPNADFVAPVAGLGAVMWEHAEVSLNDYQMKGSSASNIHYKSYLETLLSYDSQAKDTHLRAQMFLLDTPGEYNNFTIMNTGWQKRFNITKGSKEFDMMGPLAIDFFRSDKALAPNNKITIKLTKALDKFLLCARSAENEATTPYKLDIKDLQLYFYRTRLTEMIPPPTVERYLHTRTELKRFPVASSQQTYNVCIHRGENLPKSIYIGFVNTADAEGTYNSNPFYFRHLDIKRLGLRVNGRSIPSNDFTPDFTNGLINREYYSLFMNTGAIGNDRSHLISYDSFTKGSTIFAFDLSPDLCNGAHIHQTTPGEVNLELAWNSGLTSPITIIVLAVFDQVLVKSSNEADFNVITI